VPFFLDPDQRISRATLDELETSTVPVSLDAMAAFASLNSAGLRRITDPATAAVVEGLAGLGDLDDRALAGADRDTCMGLAAQAGRAGYLTGRMVLGTVYQTVTWSKSEGEGAPLADAAREIDTTLVPLPGPWGMASCTLLEMLVAEAGFHAVDESDPVAHLTATAYDSGTAMALLEHDRWRGRGPAVNN
jgi:hypothetical protein